MTDDRVISGVPKGARGHTHSKRRGTRRWEERKILPGGRCRAAGCREKTFSIEISYDPPRPDTAVLVVRAPHIVSEGRDGSWTVTITGKAGTGYTAWATNVEQLRPLTVVCRKGHAKQVDVAALQNLTRALLGT